MKKEKRKKLRGKGHKLFSFLKLFVKKPKIVYLGEKIKSPSIILSNHAGTSAPLTLDLYLDVPFRFWGTYEMNGNFGSVYKYLSEIFYHQKKHWNLFLARLFCIIAAPVAMMFYRGLNLISTYKDHRFKKTIEESIKTLKDGNSVLIFPEDSSTGYHDNLTSFFGGFATLAKLCYKKGMDLPIYVSYYIKKSKTYVVDKPILFSELTKDGFNKEKIAKRLCDRTNELKDLNFENLQKINN